MPTRECKDRKRKSDFIKALKEANPCVDCGIPYPHYIMEFDHVPSRGPKLFRISQTSKFGINSQRFQEEVAKCDIICGNCHNTRTWMRQQ